MTKSLQAQRRVFVCQFSRQFKVQRHLVVTMIECCLYNTEALSLVCACVCAWLESFTITIYGEVDSVDKDKYGVRVLVSWLVFVWSCYLSLFLSLPSSSSFSPFLFLVAAVLLSSMVSSVSTISSKVIGVCLKFCPYVSHTVLPLY